MNTDRNVRVIGLVTALLLFLLLALASTSSTFAQRGGETDAKENSPLTSISVTDLSDPGLTPEDLANALAGAGVTVSNVVYTGADVAAGAFTGAGSVIGLDSGVLLTSGLATNVIGPNSSDSITGANGEPGDADLGALIGGSTFDASVLEFDFVPDSDSVIFRFVFASDEYNEFVNSSFNDPFAFFVNGNDQASNCALVPNPAGGDPLPVAINNVNGGNPFGDATSATNPDLYNNNDLDDGGGAFDTEMDGFTDILICLTDVNAGVANQIKLAIADVADPSFDSAVFIEAGSLSSGDFVLSPTDALNLCGETHTVTATVIDDNANPVPGLDITFEVTAGPNAGLSGMDVTDAAGQASYSYTSATSGTDTLIASFVDGAGDTVFSNEATKIWQCDPPVAVTVDDFSASVDAAGGVTLGWVTSGEVNHMGFNLYRGTSATFDAATATQLNAELIAAQGSASGGAYSFSDAPTVGTYTYFLESVDTSGVTAIEAQIDVTTEAPTSAELTSISGGNALWLPLLLVGLAAAAALGLIGFRRNAA